MEMLNVHHLELFYYVAKFEGITPAVRKMPYGIQQPAVSGQMLQLEREFGVRLFNRRPFALTPAGSELFEFINPFFSGLPKMAAQLRGDEETHLRLAASGTILANHLPDVLERIRKDQPDLRLTMREVVEMAEIEQVLASGEIDFAIATLHASLPPQVKTIELLRLPLALITHESDRTKTFSALAKKGTTEITKPLVTISPEHSINLLFQEELEARGVTWTPTVEVSSLELVATYTARGYGYGLTIDAPGVEIPSGLRKIALRRFPPLRVGLLYQGKPKAIAERFAVAAAAQAKEMKSARG